MPPKLIKDLGQVDLEHVEATLEDIRRFNPQRFEMEQLSAISYFDADEQVVIGYKDVSEDEFWVRGHIPGRPLMPGVIMCEAAAQLCSYYFKRVTSTDQFLGFGGMQDVKFRGQVVPGSRLVLLARNTDLRSRRATFDCQGVVDGKLVFEAVIIGMPV
jgi:3-hydroxyacyl-[acyl-carrier-protein] dehydratase